MFIALELKKSSKEKEDKLQNHNLDLINKARGIGLKVCPETWDKVYKVLTILSEDKKYDRNELGTNL